MTFNRIFLALLLLAQSCDPLYAGDTRVGHFDEVQLDSNGHHLSLVAPVGLSGDVTMTAPSSSAPLPASAGGTGISSTATFPASGVVVTEAGTETLTNKTMPSISGVLDISSSGGDIDLTGLDHTWTFPSALAAQAVLGSNTIQTVNNKTFASIAYTAFTDSRTGSNLDITVTTGTNNSNPAMLIFNGSGSPSIASATIPSQARSLLIVNTTGNTLTVVNGGTPPGGSAAFLTGTGANLVLPDKGAVTLQYVAAATSWYVTSYNKGVLPVADGGTGTTTSTGTGSVVLSNSPVLVTPALGTPSAVVLTNATGLPLTTGVTGTLPVGNGGTGVTTSTGSGSVVLNTSPSLVTPALGTPASGTMTNVTGLPLTTGVTGTLPVGNGGTGVTTSTGSGSVVLNTSPSLVTPALGTPSAVVLTNATGLPLTTGVTGALPIANGGTGQTSASAAFNVLAPTSAKGDLIINNGTGNTALPVGLNDRFLHANSGASNGVDWVQVGLTTGVTGTLPVGNGGTGTTTSTGSGSVVLSNSPSLVTPALGTPASGVLTNATGLPLTTGVTGTLPVGNGGTGVTTSTGTGSVVLNTSPSLVTPALGTPASGVMTNVIGLPLTTGVTGTLPVGNGGTGTTTSTGTGSVVLSTSPSLTTPNLGTPSAATLTNATGLPLTSGVTGTLPIGNGGTGVTSVTTAPAATSFAGWDANSNLSANAFIQGYATTATAAGTTTLTVSSAQAQYFTGTTTQTVTLPVVSTLVLGQSYYIVNNSTGNVTVQSSGANTIQVMAANTFARFAVISTSGTGAGSWSTAYSYSLTSALPVALGGTGTTTSTGSGSVVLNTSPSLVTPALGTPSAAVLTNATGLPLTSGVTGTLPVGNGGTGVTTSTGTGSVVLNTSPSLVTPALGTPASGVLTNATGLPLTTGVTGTLPVGNGGTGTTTSTGTGSVVLSNSPALVTPALGTPASGTMTNVTGLPLTSGVTGTLPVSNGGTGVTSVTTAPTATSFAGWDANSNLSANSTIDGYATTVTAAGTTTLTVSSAKQQYFTGTTTQTVALPAVSTLVLGQVFTLVNNSTGNVTVQSSGGNTVQVMGGSSKADFTVISTSGTGAGSWNVEYSAQAAGTVTSVAMTVPTFLSVSGSPVTTNGTLAVSLSGTALPVTNGGTGTTTSTGTGSVVLSNSPALVTPALGTPASGVLTNATGLPLTTGVTGTLPIANGGTNATSASSGFNNLSPMTTAGDVIYGGTSGAGTRLAAGTSTQVFHSGTTPSWSSVSLTADVSGTLPVANGGTGTTTSTGTNNVVLSGSPTIATPTITGSTTVGTANSGNVLSVNGTETVDQGTNVADVTITLNTPSGGTGKNSTVVFKQGGSVTGLVGSAAGTGPNISGAAQGDLMLLGSTSHVLISADNGSTKHIDVAPTGTETTTSSGARTAAYTGITHNVTATSSTASINKVGVDVESTGTWNGTSAVNTGLVVNATGGTTNYAATFAGGNVGIGSTAPVATLEVNGSAKIDDTTGGTGNVPHNCTTRSTGTCATTGTACSATTTCSSGEIVTGGGCSAGSTSSILAQSTPTTASGGNFKAWSCIWTAASSTGLTQTAFAICCTY